MDDGSGENASIQLGGYAALCFRHLASIVEAAETATFHRRRCCQLADRSLLARPLLERLQQLPPGTAAGTTPPTPRICGRAVARLLSSLSETDKVVWECRRSRTYHVLNSKGVERRLDAAWEGLGDTLRRFGEGPQLAEECTVYVSELQGVEEMAFRELARRHRESSAGLQGFIDMLLMKGMISLQGLAKCRDELAELRTELHQSLHRLPSGEQRKILEEEETHVNDIYAYVKLLTPAPLKTQSETLPPAYLCKRCVHSSNPQRLRAIEAFLQEVPSGAEDPECWARRPVGQHGLSFEERVPGPDTPSPGTSTSFEPQKREAETAHNPTVETAKATPPLAGAGTTRPPTHTRKNPSQSLNSNSTGTSSSLPQEMNTATGYNLTGKDINTATPHVRGESSTDAKAHTRKSPSESLGLNLTGTSLSKPQKINTATCHNLTGTDTNATPHVRGEASTHAPAHSRKNPSQSLDPDSTGTSSPKPEKISTAAGLTGKDTNTTTQHAKGEASTDATSHTRNNLSETLESDSYVDATGRAFTWEEVASDSRIGAELGRSEAQNRLAFCYRFGKGVAKDIGQSMHWLRASAEQGDVLAQYNLGMVYHNGAGVTRSVKEATKWFRKAAEQGDPAAQCSLGLCLQEGVGGRGPRPRDLIEAFVWFWKSASRGYARGQCELGQCFYLGQGVAKDHKQAVVWYRKAADQGEAIAQDCLGICYEHGEGVASDLKQAVSWYRKTADQGCPDAQNHLGFCLQGGIGVAKNPKRAVALYRKAIAKGNNDARHNLSMCLKYGEGVALDIDESFALYCKANEQERRGVRCDPVREVKAKDLLLSFSEFKRTEGHE